MIFYNRDKEINRLNRAIESKNPALIIVYGRRRCGKSTLLNRITKKNDIYYQADLQDESIQRYNFAKEVGLTIPEFEKVTYPDWESLFTNLNNRLPHKITLIIDEFQYLIKNNTALPSIIQKLWDKKSLKYNIILCGSAQQLMQGLVLNSDEPLYGRADEIMKISPLKPFWLQKAIHSDAIKTIEEFSVWGGIPRYWELRAKYSDCKSAITGLILEKDSILYDEPYRLLNDDMRSSVQSFSILTLIGQGCNRISEISGRLNKPATQLSRPLSNLIQLGYIIKDIPFQENEKNTKRSLYKIPVYNGLLC